MTCFVCGAFSSCVRFELKTWCPYTLRNCGSIEACRLLARVFCVVFDRGRSKCVLRKLLTMGQLGDFVGGSTARHAVKANLHDTQTWWCWQANAVELFGVAAFVRGRLRMHKWLWLDAVIFSLSSKVRCDVWGGSQFMYKLVTRLS